MKSFDPRTAVLVSADSHLTEPHDLWTKRLPAHLRGRAPRVVQEDGYRSLVVEGIKLNWSKTKVVASGELEVLKAKAQEADDDREFRRITNLEHQMGHGGEGYDTQKRSRDADLDGITAEAIYPATGLYLWAIPDAQLEAACCRVYNDWIIEVFGPHERFVTPAAIPLRSMQNTLDELDYVSGNGIRAAMVPMAAMPSYNYPDWEPLWERCAALGMVICAHQGTGHDMIHYRGPNSGIVNYATTQSFAARACGLLTMAGVFDRHPDLHFIAVECGGGWMAWLMQSLDEGLEDLKYPNVPLKERPSFYLAHNVHATFQDDPVALHNIKFTGPDCLLWGNDYPHNEGTFPESRRYVAALFKDVDPEDAAKVCGMTAARVFGVEGLAARAQSAATGI